MLGLDDPWIAAAYMLCLLSTALCVVYGAINWNRGDDAPEVPEAEEERWAEEEVKIEQEL